MKSQKKSVKIGWLVQEIWDNLTRYNEEAYYSPLNLGDRSWFGRSISTREIDLGSGDRSRLGRSTSTREIDFDSEDRSWLGGSLDLGDRSRLGGSISTQEIRICLFTWIKYPLRVVVRKIFWRLGVFPTGFCLKRTCAKGFIPMSRLNAQKIRSISRFLGFGAKN